MTLGLVKPGVEIALVKNDHRGRKGHAEDHRRGRAQESLRRGAGHGQVDPRLEDTADIQLLVAENAAFGEEVAALDAMKAKKVKEQGLMITNVLPDSKDDLDMFPYMLKLVKCEKDVLVTQSPT